MAYVRRHWLSSVLYVAIIALGLAAFLTPVLFWHDTVASAQAQATEPQPIDPHLYTRVQSLRQELSLTNQDLAAMGYSKESAIALLESLKAWAASNKTALNKHHRDELNAKAALRDAIRRINVGTTDAQITNSLPDLQQTLSALYEQRKTVRDGLVAQLETLMDTYQRQTWQSARDNAGLPTQFRYAPDLTDEQRQAIHNRLTDRSATDSVSSVLDAELTWNQKQNLDSTRLNATVKAKEVRDAETVVLPVPEVLREQIVPIEDQPE